MRESRGLGKRNPRAKRKRGGPPALSQAGSRGVRAPGALPACLGGIVREAEQERTRWDPKDGELCLSRTKSEETLMEVRSDSDVQIDRQTWV